MSISAVHRPCNMFILYWYSTRHSRVDYGLDNDCKLSNCFSSAESRICNTPLVGLILNTFRMWGLIFISYMHSVHCILTSWKTMWNYSTLSHWLCLDRLSVITTWVNECWQLPVSFYWQYKPFHKNIERLLLSVAIFSEYSNLLRKFIMIYS